MEAADDGRASEGARLQPHKLRAGEVGDAVGVLCRAFVDDPFVDWVVRSDARRDEGMRRFFTVCLQQLTMPFGEVWATDDLGAVAMWTPPGSFDVGPAAQARFLWQAVRAFKLANVRSRISAFNEIERHHPQEQHYYLFFMGVDPERQGRGVGTELLTAMLRRCDAESMPAYLEATHEGLVPFYRRHGYREMDCVEPPCGCPTMYPMWRDPAGGESSPG